MAAQHPATVGDTVWAVRTVHVPAGRTVRPAAWELSGPVELLGPARLSLRGDSATVAYPLAVWEPGTHSVEMPGPELVRDDGGVDSLPPLPLVVTVASVLPEGRAPNTLQPQPAAEYVIRTETSLLPPLVLLLAAALLIVPVHLWWRRRGKAPPPPPVGRPPEAPLEKWLDLGERRVALADASERLHAAADPARENAWRALVDEIETARFEDPSPTDAAGLVARVDAFLAGR